MEIVWFLAKYNVELPKNKMINLYSAHQELNNYFDVMYEAEERFKRIVVRTPEGTLHIFKSGAITINSKFLNSKKLNDNLQKVIKILKKHLAPV